jgi:ABC-type phosphate transport system substrate-binding protein
MNVKRMKKAGLVLTAGVGLLTAGLVAGPALADPTGAPTYRQLAGVGSDTTQDVMNGLAEVVKDGSGNKLIASYDATGSANIKTKNDANCTLARPNGSGAGRSALLNSLQAGNGCVDFARSSSLNIAASNPSLTYVPFAVDAVTYAVTHDSTIPRDLPLADLQEIYACRVPGIVPLLPQSGSGTRSFWLAQMGLTETQVQNSTCIKDVKNGKVVQEHDGRALTSPNEIAPYSVAQYIAQSFGVIDDRRGDADLGAIDGKVPFVLNTDVTIKRDVYNAVPTSKLGVSPWKDVFVGQNSKICQASSVIKRYGFGISPLCGDTSNQS